MTANSQFNLITALFRNDNWVSYFLQNTARTSMFLAARLSTHQEEASQKSFVIARTWPKVSPLAKAPSLPRNDYFSQQSRNHKWPPNRARADGALLQRHAHLVGPSRSCPSDSANTSSIAFLKASRSPSFSGSRPCVGSCVRKRHAMSWGVPQGHGLQRGVEGRSAGWMERRWIEWGNRKQMDQLDGWKANCRPHIRCSREEPRRHAHQQACRGTSWAIPAQCDGVHIPAGRPSAAIRSAASCTHPRRIPPLGFDPQTPDHGEVSLLLWTLCHQRHHLPVHPCPHAPDAPRGVDILVRVVRRAAEVDMRHGGHVDAARRRRRAHHQGRAVVPELLHLQTGEGMP